MNSAPFIPDHSLIRAIGEGAYGEVWLARNLMGAWRAVKVVRRSKFADERPFEREFAGLQAYEPVSRSTSGLVHVLHVGRNDAEGFFYYVMEPADAAEIPEHDGIGPRLTGRQPDPATYAPRTLRTDMKRLGRIPGAAILRTAVELTDGLAQLHRHGLVHRDVKPANIIFVDDQAKLADIGLVSLGGGKTFVGTEGYVPPEGPGSSGGDLYALGIALYEAATGLPPERFPDLPSDWAHQSVPKAIMEMHSVILKCCESDPARRYRSVEELRADLALLESGESVREVRLLQKRVAWLRRVMLAAACIVIASVGASVLFQWRARLAEQTRATEEGLRKRAEEAERVSQGRLYESLVTGARATLKTMGIGRRTEVLEAVRQASLIQQEPELRRLALAAMSQLDFSLEQQLFADSRSKGVALEHSFSNFAVGINNDKIEIREVATGKVHRELKFNSKYGARGLRFSADNRYLAYKADIDSAGTRADLHVWDLLVGRQILHITNGISRGSLDLHPFLPRVLAARRGGRVTEWDLISARSTEDWSVGKEVIELCYSPDGKRVALSCVYADGATVDIRTVVNGELLTSRNHAAMIRGLSWQPDGGAVAMGLDTSEVQLMNATNGAVETVGTHNAQAVVTRFLRNGDFLISGGWDAQIAIWNLRQHHREMTIDLGARALQVDRTGHRILVAEGEHAQLFRFGRSDECRELIATNRLTPRAAEFSPDGRWVCVKGNDSMVVWEIGGADHSRLEVQGALHLFGFTRDSKKLYAMLDRTLTGWSLQEGVQASEGTALWQTIDPVEEVSITRGPGDTFRLTESSGLLGPQVHYATRGTSASVSRDHRWLIRRSERSPAMQLTDMTKTNRSFWLTNDAWVRSHGFSPDSSRLATVTERSLNVFDTSTWTVLKSRVARGKVFAHLQYSADGRLLLCVENNFKADILDAQTLEPLLPMPEWMHPLALSPDGRWLVVRVDGRRVQLWDFPALRARFRALGIDWAAP